MKNSPQLLVNKFTFSIRNCILLYIQWMPLNVRPDTKNVSLGEPFVKTDQFKKDKLASVQIIKKAF